MASLTVLCDTDVIIEFLKGNQSTKNVLTQIMKEHVALSAITLMELYYGALNKRELNLIKRALTAFDLFLINEDITQTAIEYIEKYSKSHHLKIPDALIAATAFHHNALLWTYNLKDFKYIEEIRLFKENNIG